ncbi:MAG: GAF domain-containing protein [Anaerolineaceae bacterium]|nr:GAF domain-containing protein [Anaerolineaceae bacterium]
MPTIPEMINSYFKPGDRRIIRGGEVTSRVLLYIVLGVFAVGGYALLIFGIGLILGDWMSFNRPLVNGLVFFLLALLFNPVRSRLQERIDRVFFQGERAYQERIQKFSSELNQQVDLESILHLVQETLESVLQPSLLHIFIYDLLNGDYAVPAVKGRPNSDVRFSDNSGLVKILQDRKQPITFAVLVKALERFSSDQVRLKILQPEVIAPLSGQQRLAGWVSIGAKLTGEPYSEREYRFLEDLGNILSLSLERTQVVMNMENRVREMNTLARVAKGINITLHLDDVLELIYAQTTQVIFADDFHLILMDPVSNIPSQIFCVEKNERLIEKENRTLLGARMLELEVIRQGKPIVTDNYSRELQRYGMIETAPVIFSWMGVPLNTDAETIGALSLGKRDTSIFYTQEQANLFQAIADQAAGAIVKARLLQESEQRARQLTTLNEMTRQLTSTLELSELLKTILQNAVNILDSEAGSLLLVDEQTDELVFKEMVGPVASDLVNRRLPPGSGIVGKAVRMRLPVIENTPQQSTAWFSNTDQQTGFQTRALLAVPLIFKDGVIGVVEVINRRDGLPFNRDDEILLLAFAAQAAVAIENARLYTMTDQALAARVEELSVMQRIDRELNASLETNTATKITLEWALRQSGADAGLIGVVAEDQFIVVESQGYEGGLKIQEGMVPLVDFPGFRKAIESGTPLVGNCQDGQKTIFLDKAEIQLIIPVRRENKTMALMVLESRAKEHYSEEILNFLVRLSDHAAIAISNAQLYTAVQQANIAKSEFVSFVSHELKNPMTSIKGYTELLAAGAVGPVNEAQGNFLSTIRSNVDRMSTLVSDLADVSRIEAGRLKLEFKAWELAEIVEEVSRSLKRQVEEKKQHLLLDIPGNLPKLWADRTRISQVITNLVSNAHKYTQPEGEICIAAERCENHWDPNGTPQVLHIWVKDNGFGIQEDDQQKIFQKFFRSEDSKTRESPGTGLGLNITRSLVELQGGKVWFESEFRKGTTFHFTVPVSE